MTWKSRNDRSFILKGIKRRLRIALGARRIWLWKLLFSTWIYDS